jgi:hypothetical protein
LPKKKDAKELEFYGLTFVEETGYIHGKSMRQGTISLIEARARDSFEMWSPLMFLSIKIIDMQP